MTGDGTDAKPTVTPETTPVPATEKTGDPRESELGDKGKELLKEMRQTIKEQNSTIKDLSEWKASQDKAAAKAADDAKGKTKQEELDKMDAVQRLEAQLAEERQARTEFQGQLQQRMLRDDFLGAADAAGVREEHKMDLYNLLQGDLAKEGADINSILEAQRDSRAIFFKEKTETQGHGGAAGTGGVRSGPAVTAIEAQFAKALGVPTEEYAKARSPQ